MGGFGSFLLSNSLKLIREYDHSQPLHRWLAEKFRQNKKWGSRDRRAMRELVHQWFRLGKALIGLPEKERVQVAIFLCSDKLSPGEDFILTESPLQGRHVTEFQQRRKIIQDVYPAFNAHDLFPFHAELSKRVDRELLELSLLQQPKVWIRIRKDYVRQIRAELNDSSIQIVSEVTPDIIALNQNTKLDDLTSWKNGYFEIQDLSSQQTASYYLPEANSHWYDCCAGSGGKSLLLLDIEPSVQLTVSDIRQSSLLNLIERFKRNRYPLPEMYVTDLRMGDIPELQGRQFDGILADVPCSGSGTWARTPESVSAFDEAKLKDFTKMQRSITSTVSEYLKPGGTLIYMTCSVFREENEDVIEWLCTEKNFRMEAGQILQGAEKGADTLYVARLIKV
jgi:16S rRNA (cytosine967-C5)-methyltransferase